MVKTKIDSTNFKLSKIDGIFAIICYTSCLQSFASLKTKASFITLTQTFRILINYKLIYTIFSLVLLSIFFTSCNRETSLSYTKNNINSTAKKVHHSKIVRTLGAKYENVICQLLDNEGNLWFSISGEGVYRYDGKSFTNITTKDGLCNNNVGAIIQDKSGNILFGTNSGICKYDGNKFTNYPMLDTLSITCMLEDKDGNLWLGVRNKGVYQYDGTNLTNFIYNYKHPFFGDKYEKYISDILQDKKGDIWFRSWNGGGVWRYDGKTIRNFLPSLDYYSTNQDKRRIDNNQNSTDLILDNNNFIQSQDNISDDMIFSISEDRAGNIWFATRGHGACRYDGKKFTSIGVEEGFLSAGAYAILEDKKGNLWFTTDKDGVWCYDGKTIKNFNEKDGLINNAVVSILEDREGYLWFGTKYFGLSRYDGKTFTTFSSPDD